MLIKLIKQWYTTAELIEKGNNGRRIKRWQRKIKNEYNEEYRKVRTPKPKIDNKLIPSFLNFGINNIGNIDDKEFISQFLNIINSNNFKNSNEQEKNMLLKRCGVFGKAGNDGEVLVFCDKCDDWFHKNCICERKHGH